MHFLKESDDKELDRQTEKLRIANNYQQQALEKKLIHLVHPSNNLLVLDAPT